MHTSLIRPFTQTEPDTRRLWAHCALPGAKGVSWEGHCCHSHQFREENIVFEVSHPSSLIPQTQKALSNFQIRLLSPRGQSSLGANFTVIAPIPPEPCLASYSDLRTTTSSLAITKAATCLPSLPNLCQKMKATEELSSSFPQMCTKA